MPLVVVLLVVGSWIASSSQVQNSAISSFNLAVLRRGQYLGYRGFTPSLAEDAFSFAGFFLLVLLFSFLLLSLPRFGFPSIISELPPHGSSSSLGETKFLRLVVVQFHTVSEVSGSSGWISISSEGDFSQDRHFKPFCVMVEPPFYGHFLSFRLKRMKSVLVNGF